MFTAVQELFTNGPKKLIRQCRSAGIGAYRNIQEHTGVYRSMQEHTGANRSIQEQTGAYRSMQELYLRQAQ